MDQRRNSHEYRYQRNKHALNTVNHERKYISGITSTSPLRTFPIMDTRSLAVIESDVAGRYESDLTVITVNWNTGKLLSRCIESVFASAGNLKVEMIVVDNGSTDDSLSRIDGYAYPIRTIASQLNLGFSKAANLAVSQAAGKHLLFVHPDVVLSTESMALMVEYLESHPDVGAVGGNLFYPDGTPNHCCTAKRSLRREFVEFGFPIKHLDRFATKALSILGRDTSMHWNHKNTCLTKTLWNACMMVRRQAIEDIGGFLPDYFVWFADTDWCYRADNAGWKLVYLAEAPVIHYEVQSKDHLDGCITEYKYESVKAAPFMQRDLDVLLLRHYGKGYRYISRFIHGLANRKARFIYNLKKHANIRARRS